MKLTHSDYQFITKWLGKEREIKSLLLEVSELQSALAKDEKGSIGMSLSVMQAIITRLSKVYGDEDSILKMAETINESDYQLCYDKCIDMSREKFYRRDD